VKGLNHTKMRESKGYLTNLPLVALVAANMVPLWGVLFLNWDAFYIVLLYWSENLVIGSYNIVKMILAQPLSQGELKKLTDERGKEWVNITEHMRGQTLNPSEQKKLIEEKVKEPPFWKTGVLYHVSKLFYIPFFAFHFGAFTAGHGFAVLMMFGKGDAGFGQIIQNDQVWPCFLVFIQLLFLVVKNVYSTIPINMKYCIAALFVSHGVSFVYHYLCRGEYKTARLETLMGQPYARLVLMHIAIIAGAFVSGAIGSPAGLLVMLVVVKTIIDIKMYLRQHRIKQGQITKNKYTD